jgi:prolyl-tRNA synthetase
LLDSIQENLYQRAYDFRETNTFVADTWEEFVRILDDKGGFISAHWDGTSETEQRIKDETKATIRLIPIDGKMEEGKCILTGKPSKQRVIFARSY